MFFHDFPFLFQLSAIRTLLLDEGVWMTVGSHPRWAHLFDTTAERELFALFQLCGVIGVGEIGLDYSSHDGALLSEQSRECQRQAFIRQLFLALDM